MKDNVENCDRIYHLVKAEVALPTGMEAHVIPALWRLRRNITSPKSEPTL